MLLERFDDVSQEPHRHEAPISLIFNWPSEVSRLASPPRSGQGSGKQPTVPPAHCQTCRMTLLGYLNGPIDLYLLVSVVPSSIDLILLIMGPRQIFLDSSVFGPICLTGFSRAYLPTTR